MNCPHHEDLIKFALDPLHEKNAELAGHISICKSCQNNLNDINPIILLPDKVTEEDIKLVKNFIQDAKKKHNLWEEFKSLIAEIWKNAPQSDSFEDRALSWGKSLLSKGWDIISSPAVGAIASGISIGSFSEPDSLVIAFIADCDKLSSCYWRAEIIIPRNITADGILTLRVTDANGEVIKNGKFTLLGIELKLNDGIAEIEFAKFKENLKNTTVKLNYPDGTVVSGDLAPWKHVFGEN